MGKRPVSPLTVSFWLHLWSAIPTERVGAFLDTRAEKKSA